MALQINGRFIKSLPTQDGDSQRGHWVRGGFVIECGEEYPKKVAFTLFGEDKVRMAQGIPAGTPVTVYFNPESREFNDRWYTDLRATNVIPGYAQAPQAYAAPAPAQQGYMPQGYAPQGYAVGAPSTAPMAQAQQPAAAATQMPENPDDDLPF